MSLFRTSLEVLKTSPVPSDLALHQRNLAEGFNKIFSSFAVEICGCANPSDRVKLKKSVWQQTVGMRLSKFEKSVGNDKLTTVAKMECPVSIHSKSSEESSPSKIILASKLLRSHVGVNESTTCRGCSKKGRCPFVHKTISNKNSKTSLGALTKVLFGLAQTCRLHLSDPEKYPFLMSAYEIESAADIVEKLEELLEPSALERQLRNVPVADRNAVKAIIKKQLKKKTEIGKEIKRQRKEGLPDWMRQRLGNPVTDVPAVETTKSSKAPKFDIDSDDWVPEEKADEFSRPNLKFKEHVDKVERAPQTVTSLDSLVDIPLVKRFVKFDQVFTKKNLRNEGKKITARTPGIAIDPASPTGGYRMSNEEPIDGIEYIKPQMMKGRTVFDNVSVAGKLWGNTNSWISELKFLHRVPYIDTVPEERVRSDPLLAEAVENKSRVSAKKNEVNLPDMFDAWKQRQGKPKRIAVIDRRFDYNEKSADNVEQWSSAEILTVSPNGVKISEMVIDERRSMALKMALAEEPESRLRFPKFPDLELKHDRVASAPRSRGGVDITSLMKPRKLDTSRKDK